MAAIDCCCVKSNGLLSRELERQPDPRELKAVETAPRQVQPYPEEYVIGGERNRYLPRLDTDQLTEDERNAHHRGHHCTDVLCLVIFVTCLAGLVWLYIYSREHGDIRRLYHGLNFKGEVCGVDKEVEDLPWLFWCAKAGDPVREGGEGLTAVLGATEDIDYDHPICVDVCPGGGDANFHHQCFQDREVQRGEADRTGTFVERITYNFRLVEDYSTQALAGGYCVPQDIKMLKALEEHVGYTETVTLAAEEVGECWLVLVLAAVVAIILGYTYLFLLQCCAGCLLYVTIAMAVLLPVIAGGLFLYGYYVEDIDEIFVRHVGESAGFEVPSTGNKEWDLIIAWALVALGLLVAALSCCCARTIELTVAVIEAVADCISDTPSFLLQPLVSTLVKLAAFAALAHGLGWLITVGEIQAHDSEVVPPGLARTFSYDRKEQLFILYYLLMAAWIIELLHALDIFVVSYATQLWFYKDQNSLGRKTMTLFPVLRGLCIGLTFHLGTLAVGSFLLALFKVAYYVLAAVARRIEEAADRDGDGRADGVVGCCLACCCCCMSCWEAFIRFMNKNAYIVTAIESKAFCPAAQTAIAVLASEPVLVASVAGATWLVTAGAIIVIVALGMYLTWLMLHMIPWFTDPTSEHFVSEPEAVTAVAGVICFIIAVTFMSVFDTVSDTILFCYIMDRRDRATGRARQGDYLPPRLQHIFEREGASSLVGTGSGPEDYRARAPLLDRNASKWA